MNTRICYMYDADKVYLRESTSFESPLEPGIFPLPANCVWEQPPVLNEPLVPVWDGYNWIAVEDHRKHMDDKGTYVGGTPYYLPEDTWQSEARYMTKLGSLPSNASLEKPLKPQAVIEKEQLESEILEARTYLEETDYVTLKIIEEPETRPQYEEILAKRKEMRAKIDPLQAQVTALNI